MLARGRTAELDWTAGGPAGACGVAERGAERRASKPGRLFLFIYIPAPPLPASPRARPARAFPAARPPPSPPPARRPRAARCAPCSPRRPRPVAPHPARGAPYPTALPGTATARGLLHGRVLPPGGRRGHRASAPAALQPLKPLQPRRVTSRCKAARCRRFYQCDFTR